MAKAPVAEGKATPGYEDPQTLARFEKIEQTLRDQNGNLKLVKNTNWLIILVLFVALMALIFAAIYQFTDAIKSETKSRDDLSQTVNELQTEVKVLQTKIDDMQVDNSVQQTPQPANQ